MSSKNQILIQPQMRLTWATWSPKRAINRGAQSQTKFRMMRWSSRPIKYWYSERIWCLYSLTIVKTFRIVHINKLILSFMIFQRCLVRLRYINVLPGPIWRLILGQTRCLGQSLEALATGRKQHNLQVIHQEKWVNLFHLLKDYLRNLRNPKWAKMDL